MAQSQDKTAIMTLAQKYQAKGQIDKAILEWEKVVQINPSDSTTHNILGDLFLKKNDKPKAMSAYFKAASLFKEHGFALKAMALYKKVLNLDPLNTDALLSLADLNSERGMLGNANESYLSAAEILVKNNAIDKALNIYEKVMQLSPDNIPLHTRIADLYGTMGLVTESAKVLQRCAEVLLEKGIHDRAEGLFQKIVSLLPSEPSGYVGLSTVLCKLGRASEASALLETVEGRMPGQEPILAAKTSVLMDLGRIEEAIRVAESLIVAKPDHPPFFNLLMDGLVRAGRFDDAWDRISKKAEALADRGQTENSLEVLAKGETFPGRENEFLRIKASVQAKAGNTGEAAETLKSLATLFADAGNREDAVRVLHEAQTLSPDDLEISARLGEMAGPLAEPFEFDIHSVDLRGSQERGSGTVDLSAEDFVKSLEEELSKGQASENFQSIELGGGNEEEGSGESGAYEIPETELDLSLLKDLGGPGIEDESTEEETVPEVSIELESSLPDLTLERDNDERHEPASPGQEEVSVDRFDEDLAEGDFYLQQGLRDEAIEIFRNLSVQYPDRPEPANRLARLVKPPLPVEPAKPKKTDARSFFESIQEESAKPQQVTEKAREEMESIFEAFKKGVEHEVEEGDFDTHYNLGIAYKEMGLIEDALREFEVAIRVQNDSIQGRSMLAMCYIENGDHNKAMVEYRRMLALLNEDDDRYVAVKYDLASTLETTGDRKGAQLLFKEIFLIAPTYKDVEARMR